MELSALDEHTLEHYRMLLDEECSAFDELEHAMEEGNRGEFEKEFSIWKASLEKKFQYLERIGIIKR